MIRKIFKQEVVMIKIMFVCHGNICRSPMAELVLKYMLKEEGIEHIASVCSSATSAEEIGNPVYPPARAELAKHGISSDGKYSVRLTRADYDKHDLFIGMDSANIRNMHVIFGGDPDGKIIKFMTFAGEDRDVADPWFTGNFDVTYRDVVSGCNKIVEYIKKNQK